MEQIILSDEDILRKQKINELSKGERPNKDIIGEYRSSEYRMFKQSFNPLAGGTVDLILTGSFTRKMFLKPTGNGFIFDSSDSKKGSLIGKYGLDIMSINQDWFNERQKNIYKFVLLVDIRKILNKY